METVKDESNCNVVTIRLPLTAFNIDTVSSLLTSLFFHILYMREQCPQPVEGFLKDLELDNCTGDSKMDVRARRRHRMRSSNQKWSLRLKQIKTSIHEIVSIFKSKIKVMGVLLGATSMKPKEMYWIHLTATPPTAVPHSVVAISSVDSTASSDHIDDSRMDVANDVYCDALEEVVVSQHSSVSLSASVTEVCPVPSQDSPSPPLPLPPCAAAATTDGTWGSEGANTKRATRQVLQAMMRYWSGDAVYGSCGTTSITNAFICFHVAQSKELATASAEVATNSSVYEPILNTMRRFKDKGMETASCNGTEAPGIGHISVHSLYAAREERAMKCYRNVGVPVGSGHRTGHRTAMARHPKAVCTPVHVTLSSVDSGISSAQQNPCQSASASPPCQWLVLKKGLRGLKSTT